MRDAVLLLALMGALVELLVLAAGSALAPPGVISWLSWFPSGLTLAISVAATAVSLVLGIFVMASNANGRRAGIGLVGVSVLGSLASGNGLYILGAIMVAAAGLLALFVRTRRPSVE